MRSRPLGLVLLFSLVAGMSALVACSGESGMIEPPRDNGGTTSPEPGQEENTPDEGTSPNPPGEPAPTDGGVDAYRPDPERGQSAGCGNAAGTKGLATQKVTIANVERSYLRFVPNAYAANKPMTLVIGLHGSGGTSERARGMFAMETEAAGKAIFLYPQALPSPDPQFDGDNRWDPAKNGNDIAFIDAIIARIEASHCIDRDRIFVTGFSLGARFTSMLGCYRGDVLRAIAPVAPGGTPTTLPLTGCVGHVGVWEGLGTLDADHEQGARIVREYYSRANGCTSTRTPTTPAGCEAFTGCRTETPVVWCSYTLGHAWPSIGSAGVWKFFDAFK